MWYYKRKRAKIDHFTLFIKYDYTLAAIFRDIAEYGLTTLNKPKSREVSTNDGIITQNILNAAVPTSIETK